MQWISPLLRFLITANQTRFKLLALCLLWSINNTAQAISDPLKDLASRSSLASQSLLLDVAMAGQRVVTVGERGHILYSDNSGKHWQQAQVPVRVTLTAVHFPTPEQGWAVGHDGVILHSKDGGVSWSLQMNGYQLNRLVEQQTQTLLEQAKQGRSDVTKVSLNDLAYLAKDAANFTQEGPTRPLLDVFFTNSQQGFAVGAYGLILTTEDGGATWRSLVGHLDNPFGFHLYAVEQAGPHLWVAGEAGQLHRLDSRQQWQRMETPYDGTLFGIAATPHQILVYGLRGHAYRSLDNGASWHPLTNDNDASLEGGLILPNGHSILVGQGGTLMTADRSGHSLSVHHLAGRPTYSAITLTPDQQLLLVGQKGVHLVNPESLGKEVN